MGRHRKYTGIALKKAVEAYFERITREKEITESVATGERDKQGHAIYEDVPVRNRRGETVTEIEYILPPTVGGLCAELGITRETWDCWQDSERFPEYADTIARARGRMRAWNEIQLLTRGGKDVKGIIFNLQNNYGYSERSDVRVTGGVEEYLRRLDEQGRGQSM